MEVIYFELLENILGTSNP